MSTQAANGRDTESDLDTFVIGTCVVAGLAAVIAGLPWIGAMLVGWVHSGHLPTLSLVDSFKVGIDPQFWIGGDPAAAYPRAARQDLPGAWGYWTTVALTLILLVAGALAALREVARRSSRVVADRRWWHVFAGRKPQSFGRYETVKPLIVKGPSPDRIIIGRIAKPQALLAAERDVHLAVIAAPRSGKTTGLVQPALLEHEGPVVTTSTKTDIVRATIARRRQLGDVLVWDPFNPTGSDGWDPLQGCEEWAHALLVAKWINAAVDLGDGGNSKFFGDSSEELVAPLLHAAALDGTSTIVDVFRWVLDREEVAPMERLKSAGADDAISRLHATYKLNDRQLDGVISTAQAQLKAYGNPGPARTAARGEGLTPERLFDGGANTLYIVAGREHQKLLAPLVVTMLGSLLYYASERENAGHPINPQALFALDETAQIAPMRDLAEILSVSLSSGIRYMTIWHSVSQMRQKYGADTAANILALSQAKLFLGSITDDQTRRELVNLLGEQAEDLDGRTQYRDALSAQALQRLQTGRGLLIHGQLPPTFFDQRRAYNVRRRVILGS